MSVLRRLLIGLAVIAVVGALAWGALASPATRIRHIRIDGVTGPVEDSARAAADRVRGRSVLLTHTGDVAAAVERDVRVADARVTRHFPDTIVVTVIPRLPVLAAENSKGQLELVDIEGVRIGATDAPPAGLPVVRGAESSAVTEGALRVALDVVTAMPAAMRSGISGLTVTPAESVTFAVGGTEISWGDASETDTKARLVAILLQHKPKTIDVSAPSTPVTT